MAEVRRGYTVLSPTERLAEGQDKMRVDLDAAAELLAPRDRCLTPLCMTVHFDTLSTVISLARGTPMPAHVESYAGMTHPWIVEGCMCVTLQTCRLVLIAVRMMRTGHMMYEHDTAFFLQFFSSEEPEESDDPRLIAACFVGVVGAYVLDGMGILRIRMYYLNKALSHLLDNAFDDGISVLTEWLLWFILPQTAIMVQRLRNQPEAVTFLRLAFKIEERLSPFIDRSTSSLELIWRLLMLYRTFQELRLRPPKDEMLEFEEERKIWLQAIPRTEVEENELTMWPTRLVACLAGQINLLPPGWSNALLLHTRRYWSLMGAPARLPILDTAREVAWAPALEAIDLEITRARLLIYSKEVAGWQVRKILDRILARLCCVKVSFSRVAEVGLYYCATYGEDFAQVPVSALELTVKSMEVMVCHPHITVDMYMRPSLFKHLLERGGLRLDIARRFFYYLLGYGRMYCNGAMTLLGSIVKQLDRQKMPRCFVDGMAKFALHRQIYMPGVANGDATLILPWKGQETIVEVMWLYVPVADLAGCTLIFTMLHSILEQALATEDGMVAMNVTRYVELLGIVADVVSQDLMQAAWNQLERIIARSKLPLYSAPIYKDTIFVLGSLARYVIASRLEMDPCFASCEIALNVEARPRFFRALENSWGQYSPLTIHKLAIEAFTHMQFILMDSKTQDFIISLVFYAFECNLHPSPPRRQELVMQMVPLFFIFTSRLGGRVDPLLRQVPKTHPQLKRLSKLVTTDWKLFGEVSQSAQLMGQMMM